MWSGKLIYYSMSSSFKATFLKVWGLIPFKILASNLVSFFYTCFIVGVPYIAPLVIYAVLAYYCPGVQAVDLTQGVTVLDMQEGFWGNPFLTNVIDRESPLPLTDILRVPGPHAIDPALESTLIDQVSFLTLWSSLKELEMKLSGSAKIALAFALVEKCLQVREFSRSLLWLFASQQCLMPFTMF